MYFIAFRSYKVYIKLLITDTLNCNLKITVISKYRLINANNYKRPFKLVYKYYRSKQPIIITLKYILINIISKVFCFKALYCFAMSFELNFRLQSAIVLIVFDT